ncbi:MAG TPA: D-arabinono-1,4-lactone oxidase [Micromonosporaceae bacterium]
MGREWANWSGSVRFTPAELAQPADEAEVVELVRRARERGRLLRPVGAGHSSSPLVRTDDILVGMDRLTGPIQHHREGALATFRAGTRLREVGKSLFQAGLAMENLGDVDYQTLVGATATGTHGTGVRFGNLSTQVVGVRLVTGLGEVLDISDQEHPRLLPAARMSLGALGVITRLTLRLKEVYEVERTAWCMPVDWTLAHLEELQSQNRNMDFYWYPRSDLTQIRILNRRGEQPGFRPPTPPRLHRVGPSHEEIPQHRELRFDEIEYMMPVEAFPACFAELRRRIKERHRVGVGWRVLVRTIAADDIYLSPSYRRDTVSIACLQNAHLPYDEYFADAEAVFLDHGGRPHWGKKHSLTAPRLRPLYPHWDTFREIRRMLDPDGVFRTPYLAGLLGEH